MFEWRSNDVEGLKRYFCYYNGNKVASIISADEKWCCYNNISERIDNKEYSLTDAQNLVERWYLGCINKYSDPSIGKVYQESIHRLERQNEFERRESKELYLRLEEKHIELAKTNALLEIMVKSVTPDGLGCYVVDKNIYKMCCEYLHVDKVKNV